MERRWNNAVTSFVLHLYADLISFLPCSVISVPSSTAYILTYDHLLKNVLPPLIPLTALVPMVAGVMARTVVVTIASPLELIRTNLQSTPISPGQPHTLRSVLSSIRNLTQQRGISALWRGLTPSLWRDTTFSGFYWASYEAWKRKFARHGHEGAWIAFLSGAISGTSAALLTSPFDVLKTRRQALLVSPANVKMPRTIPLLLQVVRTEGPAALYAGITPRICKIAPACGIMIACFEVCNVTTILDTVSDSLTRESVNYWPNQPFR